MIILIMPEKSQQTRGTQNALESEWERTLKHYKQSRSLGYCKHWAEYFWGEKIVIHILLDAVWLFILDFMQVALVILCLRVGFFLFHKMELLYAFWFCLQKSCNIEYILLSEKTFTSFSKMTSLMKTQLSPWAIYGSSLKIRCAMVTG